MSSSIIVEALKQGNAAEEDIVKMMKEGFDTIADNMLQECRKRSAALEDLEENIAAARIHNKNLDLAKTNAGLAHAVSLVVEECKKAIDTSYDRYKAARNDACVEFNRQMDALKQLSDKHSENKKKFATLMHVEEGLKQKGWQELHEMVLGLYNQNFYDFDEREDELCVERRNIRERRDEVIIRSWNARKKERIVWEDRIAAIEHAAETVGLKLDN